MITLTEKAVDKLKEIASDEGIVDLIVRAKVIGGGCAGFSYDMFFENNPADMDERFEQNGITIITDILSHQYLDGTTIDYTDGLITSGFVFENPNITGSCGCKSSVSF